MRTVLALTMLAGMMLWAADRPEVSGTWLFDPADAGKLKIASLAIHQSEDAIQISQVSGTDAKAKRVDLACSVGGDPCKLKEAGEEVSFWFNGPALVMMEMRHNKEVVTKTRLLPSSDGKTLHMEVIHIAPSGHKDETYTLTKQAGS